MRVQSVNVDKSGQMVNSRGLTFDELKRLACHHNERVRKDAITGTEELLRMHPVILSSRLKEIIESAFKCLSDPDGSVRLIARRLVRHVVINVSEAKLLPFADVMSAYLCSALTSLRARVRVDAAMALRVVIESNSTLLRRHVRETLRTFPALLHSAKGHRVKILGPVEATDATKAIENDAVASLVSGLDTIVQSTFATSIDDDASSTRSRNSRFVASSSKEPLWLRSATPRYVPWAEYEGGHVSDSRRRGGTSMTGIDELIDARPSISLPRSLLVELKTALKNVWLEHLPVHDSASHSNRPTTTAMGRGGKKGFSTTRAGSGGQNASARSQRVAVEHQMDVLDRVSRVAARLVLHAATSERSADDDDARSNNGAGKTGDLDDDLFLETFTEDIASLLARSFPFVSDDFVSVGRTATSSSRHKKRDSAVSRNSDVVVDMISSNGLISLNLSVLETLVSCRRLSFSKNISAKAATKAWSENTISTFLCAALDDEGSEDDTRQYAPPGSANAAKRTRCSRILRSVLRTTTFVSRSNREKIAQSFRRFYDRCKWRGSVTKRICVPVLRAWLNDVGTSSKSGVSDSISPDVGRYFVLETPKILWHLGNSDVVATETLLNVLLDRARRRAVENTHAAATSSDCSGTDAIARSIVPFFCTTRRKSDKLIVGPFVTLPESVQRLTLSLLHSWSSFSESLLRGLALCANHPSVSTETSRFALDVVQSRRTSVGRVRYVSFLLSAAFANPAVFATEGEEAGVVDRYLVPSTVENTRCEEGNSGGVSCGVSTPLSPKKRAVLRLVRSALEDAEAWIAGRSPLYEIIASFLSNVVPSIADDTTVVASLATEEILFAVVAASLASFAGSLNASDVAGRAFGSWLPRQMLGAFSRADTSEVVLDDALNCILCAPVLLKLSLAEAVASFRSSEVSNSYLSAVVRLMSSSLLATTWADVRILKKYELRSSLQTIYERASVKSRMERPVVASAGGCLRKDSTESVLSSFRVEFRSLFQCEADAEEGATGTSRRSP
eukprot:g3303.t1